MPANWWGYRCAVLIMIAGLIAIVSGAFITSSEIVAGQGRAGQGSSLHTTIGIALAVLVFGLAAYLSSAGANAWLRGLAWSAFAALAAGGALGWRPPLSPASVVLHAVSAHFFLACMTAVARLASPEWSRAPEPVEARGWTSLRSVAMVTPAAVLVQIVLGALYRHQVIGIMWHMAGGMVVALLTLVVSVVLLQHFPEHRQLKGAAAGLITIVLAQVCLGITVFILLLLEAGNTAAFAWIATGHVSVGAMTLAASVWMAMQVRRDIAT